MSNFIVLINKLPKSPYYEKSEKYLLTFFNKKALFVFVNIKKVDNGKSSKESFE